MDTNRVLVHSGRLFKSNKPGLEQTESDFKELFVLLLDNYRERLFNGHCSRS